MRQEPPRVRPLRHAGARDSVESLPCAGLVPVSYEDEARAACASLTLAGEIRELISLGDEVPVVYVGPGGTCNTDRESQDRACVLQACV